MLKSPSLLSRQDETRPTRNPLHPAESFGASSSTGAARPAASSAPPAQAGGSAAAAGTTGAHVESTTGNRLIVGPDVKLKGAEILDCDTLVVEGRVEATMDSHLMRIAEQGAYNGVVSIDTAEIHGRFEGELTARCQLIIHATGRVTGKIRYGKILIEEGGQLCGDVQSMTENHPAAKPASEKPAMLSPRPEVNSTRA